MKTQPGIPEHVEIYAADGVVVVGIEGDYPPADARAMGQLLIDHADAIDKAAHDKHAAEVLERRNKVTRRYMNANWNDLSNRVTRTLIDRIIELETQQEENK